MWIADNVDKKIYAYSRSTKARDSSKDFNTLDAAGNTDATGIWSDGTTMWAADGVDDKIYAYNLATKARDSSKDFDTLDAALNENPYGIWSDGRTMWVVDATDDKIYSYNMELSDDATLSAIRVDSRMVPGFHAERTAYQYGVGNTVTQVTVTATTNHASATVAFSPTDASTTTSGHQVDVSAGSNAVTITVTAQETTTTKTYTLSVNRGVTASFGWKVADDFDTLKAAGNDLPIGIWSDGTTMWTADATDKKIYAYNLSSKARDQSKDFDTLDAAANDNPAGIWSNGTTMWVTDTTDEKIYAYNLSTKARDSSKDFDTLQAAGNQFPWGLWSDGITMWVVDNYEVKIYAYNLATKARDASKDFDTLDTASNDNPIGLWSDGTTVWVTDETNNKIYAYSMSTKARDASKDFNTLHAAGNDSPADIWSHRTTMWVVEGHTTDKIYSYNGPPSDNATLSAITVDGTAVTGFDADQTSYQYGVAHTTTQVTVAATTNHASATVAFSPADASTTTSGHQVNLSAGSNAVTITVTAQDTTTTKTYTVSVNRGVSDDLGWKASEDFDTLTAAGNDDPIGTWSDGDTMWVVDNTDGKIYAYRMSTKAHDSSKDFDTLIAAGNENPTGIWSDRTTMWVADSSTDDKLYAYNLSTKARDSSKDFDTLDPAGNNNPWDIWSNGDSMWVMERDEVKIYAYSMSTKAHDSSKDFDTLEAAGNTTPDGIWSDGDTMWVSDFEEDKLYAYNLSTKARDSSKDFNTLDAAGNNIPYGMWSDGTTMWVTDVQDDKIYSYNVPRSDDATLSAITVDGTMVPRFDADQTSYQYGVSHTVTQVTVAATTSHADATVAFSPADADTSAPGHQVDLSAGSNAVTITVTAENTTTTKEYTISVNRGVTDDFGWKVSDDFDTLIAAGNLNTYGIWSDGDTMWLADDIHKKLYAYSMSTKARDPSKDFDTLDDAGNDDPTGIWSDRTTMWVADFDDDKLYAYSMSTKARDSSKDFDTLDAAGNGAPRGIWSDGATMWVADGFDKKIYAYSMSTKAHDSSKDFDTLDAADNDNPTGLWSDGNTMWVADDSNEKLYAYNLSTKARDSSKDFNTLDAADNEGPVGIWSDGATMWVADYGDLKIYSYNMDLPAPSNLDAIHGSRRVALLWDGPASTDISVFQYRVSADSGTSWSPDWKDIPGSGANTRTYTVTGLTNGAEYTFQVRAVYTRAGQRLVGQVSTVRATPQIPPPAQPSGFRATHGDTEVSLSWNNPGDSTITHYQYRVSPDGRASWTPDWTNIPDSNRSTTRLTVEGLTNDTEYTFEVRAVNAGGESGAATGTATPRDLSPPVLASTTVNGTELELTYDEPLDENSLPNQDQYTLSVSPRPATPVAVSNVSISGAVVTLTLAPAVEDIHTVRLTYRAPSTNAIADPTGNRAPRFSNRLVTNNSPLPQVPDAPTSLRATPKGPNRIDLTWTAPANEGGAAVSGYKIEVSTNNSSWTDLATNTSSTETTHSHTSLELGNRRYYRVSAINRGGTSQHSSVANATTDNRPYLTMTARRIRTDSVPTEVGTLRVPVYEVMIEASQPVKGIGDRWAYDAVRSYITNGTAFSWGAVATSRSGIPAHHTKWRLEVIPHLPETRGPNTVTIAVPEGVVEDGLTKSLPNRRNRAQTPFKLVVENLPSSDIRRPRATITYEQGHPVHIIQTGTFDAKVKFSEPVSGFEQNELRVTGAAVTSFTSNQNGTIYSATIRPNDPRGEEHISITLSVSAGVASDRAGHTNLGAQVGLMARPRPTVEIIIPKANPNPSTMNSNDAEYLPESGWFYKSQSSAFDVIVKFSKPVTEFVQEELVVEGYEQADRTCHRAGGASITNWSSRANGTEHVATITPTATGIIAISVAAGVAQDSDLYLNLGEGRHFVYMSMPGSDDADCQIEDAP